MSSPLYTVPPLNLTAYRDLRVYDRTPQDIFEAALALLRLNIPGYAPREGDTEVMLLESLAVEASEMVAALNRLPGAVVETVLTLAEVERDYGNPATAAVQIASSDTLGRYIPPGTRIIVPTEVTNRSVMFLLESPGVTIPQGSYSSTGTIISDSFTAAANGMPIGTVCSLADNTPWVESVTLTMQVADGRGVEPDEDWRDRGVKRLRRLSDVIATPQQFEAAAEERTEVERAVCIDNYDPGSAIAAGSNGGHVTVGVLGQNGAPLSAATKNLIDGDLEAMALANLEVHVVDAVVTQVPITVKVKRTGTVTLPLLSDAIRAALNTYLDPLRWPSKERVVRINELVSVIDPLPGVDYVTRNGITINGVADDWVITGLSGLPDLGAFTLTEGV